MHFFSLNRRKGEMKIHVSAPQRFSKNSDVNGKTGKKKSLEVKFSEHNCQHNKKKIRSSWRCREKNKDSCDSVSHTVPLYFQNVVLGLLCSFKSTFLSHVKRNRNILTQEKQNEW